MIDRDLAEMYGVETRTLNQSVKRSLERFPEDFMFQLSNKEFQAWKSQIVISNLKKTIQQYMELASIQNKIYTFRNQKVMLDFDLADLYEVETKRLKEAVRRNKERFEGDDFMFQLSGDEIVALSRTQFATLNKPVSDIDKLQTEFKELQAYIENVFADYNDINEDTRMQIELINQSLAELHTDKNQISKPRNKIGFITET